MKLLQVELREEEREEEDDVNDGDQTADGGRRQLTRESTHTYRIYPVFEKHGVTSSSFI